MALPPDEVQRRHEASEKRKTEYQKNWRDDPAYKEQMKESRRKWYTDPVNNARIREQRKAIQDSELLRLERNAADRVTYANSEKTRTRYRANAKA